MGGTVYHPLLSRHAAIRFLEDPARIGTPPRNRSTLHRGAYGVRVCAVVDTLCDHGLSIAWVNGRVPVTVEHDSRHWVQGPHTGECHSALLHCRTSGGEVV